MAQEAELVGKRIKERREELGWTQRELAAKLPGKTEGKDISRYEGGKHLPASNTRSAIAEALGTTVADLIQGPVADRQEREATPDPFTGGAALPYKVADVERGIRMEAKLDAILNHFKIEWLEPDAAFPGSSEDSLREAEAAAKKLAPKKSAPRRKQQRR